MFSIRNVLDLNLIHNDELLFKKRYRLIVFNRSQKKIKKYHNLKIGSIIGII